MTEGSRLAAKRKKASKKALKKVLKKASKKASKKAPKSKPKPRPKAKRKRRKKRAPVAPARDIVFVEVRLAERLLQLVPHEPVVEANVVRDEDSVTQAPLDLGRDVFEVGGVEDHWTRDPCESHDHGRDGPTGVHK